MTQENPGKTPETMTELFEKAVSKLRERGIEAQAPSGPNLNATAETNRRLLDGLFMAPRFLDLVEPDTSLELFGAKLSVPAFCSALSKPPYLSDEGMVDIVRGMGAAGSMMMLGIGGSDLLQAAIDTGTPVVKMVKPYRETELIYTKVRDAESRGCVATGMDIDHFYGIYRDGRSMRAELFSPKTMEEVRQAISLTKLPFIVKGVLSAADAEKAIELGATALLVSNHGGASFDAGVPSVMALPAIVKAAGDRATVLVDTGFRSGNDIFKGLALGAKAVGFATSVLMASNAGGAASVSQFVGFLAAELKRTMAVCGCAGLGDIDGDRLIAAPDLTPWW